MSDHEEMFNPEQRAHMAALARIPREQRCDCGWERRGECMGSCFGSPEKGGHERCGLPHPRLDLSCSGYKGHPYNCHAIPAGRHQFVEWLAPTPAEP